MDDEGDGPYSRIPDSRDAALVCRALNDVGARYVLIGGFAVIAHGFARTTKDIDVLVDASPENVAVVKRGLSVLPDNAARLVDDTDVQDYGVIRIADEFVVDLLGSACGVTYADAIKGAQKIDIHGILATVADKETLIRTKQTIRPHDALDVEYLRTRLEEERRRLP